MPLLCCIAFAACQGGNSTANAPATLAAAQALCQGGRRHVEIHDRGIVTRVLGVRAGRGSSHEGFVMQSPGRATHALAVRVEDNVSLTGFIPLRVGDRVEVQGQYECDDAVVHWTHHDPSGRHIGGFITANGRTYR
ncbi:MAG: DUF3465 domain-containing protein [Vulcanimicrobiaceae bacterium]